LARNASARSNRSRISFANLAAGLGLSRHCSFRKWETAINTAQIPVPPRSHFRDLWFSPSPPRIGITAASEHVLMSALPSIAARMRTSPGVRASTTSRRRFGQRAL
jgi:hypothetical protein